MKVQYFATSVGFVIEVLDGGGFLIDDHRTHEPKVGRDVLLVCARQMAFEMAAKFEIPFDLVSYDHEGENGEEAFFSTKI